MISSAVISADHLYRYELRRAWGTLGPTATFVMLNPSTADAHVDDPTIRRCVGFAQREGCDSLTVINLLAWRATNPRDLPADWSAIGPDNDATWSQVVGDTGPLIAAWGSASALQGMAAVPFRTQIARFAKLCRERGVDLMCLGTTKNGQPRHPLYVRADQPLVRFT